MGFTETLRLLVEADTKGAVTNVEKLGKTSDRELSRSKTSLDKWGNGLSKVGAGMVTFGAVALAGLGKAAMASEEARLSEVKLENTLANMPKLAGENKQQFIDLADAIQDKTAADGDAIIAGEAMLGTFNLTAEQIKGITPLVVDYARKFGLDIPQAATMVGKALDGSVGALKRNGVSIDEVMFKTDRYGAVQKALTDQVGGFAEAEGKTFAGSLQRLKNELGDIVEGVGAGAVDAFTDLAGAADFVTDRFGELSPETQSLIGKIATFGAVGLIAAGGISTLVGQAIKMRENFSVLKDGLANVRTALSSTAGGLLAVEAAGAAALFAIHEMGKAAHDAKIRDLADDFVATGDAAGVLEDAFGKGDPFAAGNAADVLDRLIDTNLAAAERFVDSAEAAGAEEDAVKAAREAIERKRDADTQAAVDQDANTAAVQEGTEAMGDQADATDDAKSALQEYSDQLKAMTDPIFGAMDAVTDNKDAQLAFRDAQAQVLTTQQALSKAIRDHGRDSEEARDATRDYEDATRKLTDAEWGTVESAAHVDSALATLKDAVENGDVSMDDFRKTLDLWVRQGFLTQQQANNAAMSVGGLASQADAADRKRVDIPVKVTGTPAARRRIQETKEALDRLPGNKNITINVAAQGLAAINIQLAKLGGYGGGRASGGPVTGGVLYKVAERGEPELFEDNSGDTYFIPPKSGQVTPARAGGGRGSGGGDTYIFNVRGSLVDVSDLMGMTNKATRKGRGLKR